MRKNNGITLISLVITIIIMLILVGVSITLAVKGGLFGYAGNAVSDTNSEKNKEYEQLNGKIKIDGEWYESIDEYLNFSERAELPDGIKVGDYVNYTPTKGTYSLPKDISGYTADQTFETETKENNNELEWRILSINRRSGEIELVSATVAQSEKWVYLDEANGYNFGVDVLNDLCKSLYSNTAGAEARSMNIDDVNKKTTYNAEKDASNYNQKYKSTIFKDFPSLYTIEKGSEIEGVTKGTLTENEGVRNADGTANYTKYKGIQTSASWYVTHTYYNYDIKSYLDNDLGMNTAPIDLFVIDNDYLLASRFVEYSGNGEWIEFGLREASSNGRVYGRTCYSSEERYVYEPSGSASSYSKIGIRPVINLGTNFKITKAATPDGKNGTYWDIEFTKDNNPGTLEKTGKDGYAINSIEDLVGLAYSVNKGEDQYLGKTIKLVRNLDFQDDDSYVNPNAKYVLESGTIGYKPDASGTSIKDLLLGSTGFVPIGTSNDVGFYGTLDGNNKIIKNMKVCVAGYGGLIGCTRAEQETNVKNLGMEESNINCGGVSGGIAAISNGDIIVTNCYNTGKISVGSPAGGIVGMVSGEASIANCYNSGNLSSGSPLGGIVGIGNQSLIVSDCYNTGTILGSYAPAGGIVGTSALEVTNCYNAGNVTTNNSSGGIIGERKYKYQ